MIQFIAGVTSALILMTTAANSPSVTADGFKFFLGGACAASVLILMCAVVHWLNNGD